MEKLTIEFDSVEQAEYVLDILHWWIEDHEEATKEVEKDPALESPEQMLEAIDGMVEQYDQVQRVCAKVREVVCERNTASQ